ncbi:MAG: hypothetical protein KIT84_15270 [Labilithrix sp.]|nr:hypothetical protein [Labilithrix sp.]MCW5812385.1 hypothetical protein [Labilithrix sp.]
MQPQTRRLALFFVASMFVGVGVLVACDTDNSTVPLPGGGSSTSSSSGKPKPADDDDDNVDVDDDDDDDNGGPKDAGGADCATAPRLRNTSAGFYCGFFRDGGPDSGGASNCSNVETCCNPGREGSAFPPSFCAPGSKTDKGQDNCSAAAPGYGSTWVENGSTTWECNAASNCGSGRTCCAFSAAGAEATDYVNVGRYTGTGAPPAACGAQFIYKIAGTKCATSCKTDKSEIELCSSTSKCPDGRECLPARTTGSRDMGYCK